MGLSVCDRHMEVTNQLQDHDKRIKRLELSDVEQREQIKNLCKELSNLTNWIKVLVGAMLGSLVAFFFWYVQSLGGR